MPNKAEFIELLAQRLDEDKKRAAHVLDAVIHTVYVNIARGERVTLTGFGIFEKRDRAARIARNPATGARVRVKKTSVPAFRPGAEFKAITSGAKKLGAKKAAPAKKADREEGCTPKKVHPRRRPRPQDAAKKAAVKKSPARKVAR